MKYLLSAALAAFLVVGAVACDEDGATAQPSTIDSQLASIDAGTRIEADDARVTPYSGILDILEVRCAEPRRGVGDLAVFSREKLRDDYGKSVTVWEMLDAARVATSDLDQTVGCAEIFAALILLTGAQ